MSKGKKYKIPHKYLSKYPVRKPMIKRNRYKVMGGKNGEKAKDKSVGAIVLLIRENIPNVAPKIAPASGPNTIAPIITGMCTVVALIIGN